MKYFTLEDINKDSFEAVIVFLEKEWEKTIYVNSPWWTVTHCTLLLREINSRNDVTLIAYNISSSAFDLFYGFNGKKYLMDWCRWLIHQMYLENISVNSRWKIVYSNQKCAIKSLKQRNTRKYEFLTKKEKKQYDKWRDINLSYKRLKKIFPNAEIL